MIVDEQLGLIFVKPAKVAGSSIEVALRQILSPSARVTAPDSNASFRSTRTTWVTGQKLVAGIADVITRHPPQTVRLLQSVLRRQGPCNKTLSDRLSREQPHSSASEIKLLVGDDSWKRCLKVSVCRHPYTRLRSGYYWSGRPSEYTFHDWIFASPEVVINNERIIAQERRGWYRFARCEIDVFLRFECLEDDLIALCDELGRPHEAVISTLRATRIHDTAGASWVDRLPIAELIDSESKRLIDLLGAPEFDRFGYERDFAKSTAVPYRPWSPSRFPARAGRRGSPP